MSSTSHLRAGTGLRVRPTELAPEPVPCRALIRRGERSPLSRSVTGGPVSLDPLSVPLEDDELLAEIQLLTELILAATHRDEDALDQATIDRVLGLGEPATEA